jgi:hypothetical protein
MLNKDKNTMKTSEEAALEKWPIDLVYDFGKNRKEDINEDNRKLFIEGYNYRESFVAAEREKAVNEFKKKFLFLLAEHEGSTEEIVNKIINLLTPEK